MKDKKTPLVVVLVSAIFLAFWGAKPKVVSQNTPRDQEQASARARMEDHFPNVVLRTHENQEVRFYDDLVKGKVVLISFMYTACEGICPMTTANLVRVQNLLGDLVGRDIFLYSITLDPETDTPEVLKQYAEAVGAKRGWPFLTGKYKDIELLRHRLGISDPDPVIDADKSQHGGILVYGNEARGRWAAIPALIKPERIVQAVLKVIGA